MAVAETDRPKIHPYVRLIQDPYSGTCYVQDQLQRNRQVLRVGPVHGVALLMLDGRRTLRELQAEIMRQLEGRLVSFDDLARLVSVADDAGFLEGPRFQRLREDPVREPSCVGVYPEDPDRLREQFADLFRRGAGLPRGVEPDGSLRAVLAPHIDYARGGLSYTWAFKDLFERSDAELFVIVGTSHCSPHRFTLTRKHFRTPLGVAETDRAFVDRLVKHYGDGLFDDELGAHLPEHSIELEVVFLQYLYGGGQEWRKKPRPFRIVPLVVGSFHDCVEDGSSPAEREDVLRMIQALRLAEEETKERVCYVISGDLAHIGRYFRDPGQLDDTRLEHSRRQDEELVRLAEAVDAEGYFRFIAGERDARRICGLPPTYTVLQAARPGRGKLLHYGQAFDRASDCSVSFASVSFDR